jgi:hypothetical protein
VAGGESVTKSEIDAVTVEGESYVIDGNVSRYACLKCDGFQEIVRFYLRLYLRDFVMLFRDSAAPTLTKQEYGGPGFTQRCPACREALQYQGASNFVLVGNLVVWDEQPV